MEVYIFNHDYLYELENLTRVFFPNDKITVLKYMGGEDMKPPFVYTAITEDKMEARLCDGEFDKTVTAPLTDGDEELALMTLVFDLFTQYTGYVPKWGLLTGVRPIKLMRRLKDDMGEREAKKYFREKLLVSEEKTDLACETEKNERKILDLSQRNSFSLYVSIPFCPSRCSYCSFVSQSVEKAKHLVEPYLELLVKEIKKTAEIAESLKLNLETVYIGGGTPTTLSAEQLKILLDAIKSSFDLGNCREFTVEAGRPDTITFDKLKAILEGGADRISVNPQTLNDNVLENIGRRHTAQQAIDAFKLARQAGVGHINMDLIAGLPGDTIESFRNTLDGICELDPESITVHTLSMKKSSGLTAEGKQILKQEGITASLMLEYTKEKLSALGYKPYYLYRQSRMVGNLENVGWAKEGFESSYNVFVMDETHTVLGCGAGAVTKLKEFGTDRLERIFNFKYPYEYNTRFDEIIERKKGIAEFYAKYF